MEINPLFAFSKTKKKKKVDAARFLDARGDEKQVIYLERPKINFKTVGSEMGAYEPRSVPRLCLKINLLMLMSYF